MRLRKILQVQDQMMTFYEIEETNELLVSVVCGGIAMFEVTAKVLEEEKERISDETYQRWIGSKIRKEREKFSDRIVELDYSQVEIIN